MLCELLLISTAAQVILQPDEKQMHTKPMNEISTQHPCSVSVLHRVETFALLGNYITLQFV